MEKNHSSAVCVMEIGTGKCKEIENISEFDGLQRGLLLIFRRT